jgi:hypothetical protein
MFNAYHDLPYKVDVFDSDGTYVGRRGGYSARCTAKSPGSVTIITPNLEEIWYSGPISKFINSWKLDNFKKN